MPLQLPPLAPCSFCDYLAGVRPYTILERDDVVAMFVTYEPRGVGHVLVIPHEHRVTILDLTPTEQQRVMDGAVRAAHAIVGAYDPGGVAIWQNNGMPAHQTVPHVHVHVAGTLPGGGTAWGDVERLNVAETEQIAEVLRPHLPPSTLRAADQ